MLGAVGVGRVARVFAELGPPDGLHQPLEDGVAVAADGDVGAVLGAVGVARGDAGEGAAGPLAHDPSHVVLRHHRLHEVEDRLVERHVDHLPLAGAPHVPGVHRREGPYDGVERGERVAEADAAPHRGPVRLAGDVSDASHRLADVREPGPVLVRPRLPVAGDAHQDEPGIHLVEDLPPEPQLLQGTGLEVLDQDVALCGEPLRKVEAVRVAHVQRHELLVAGLERPPEGGLRAGVHVAPGPQGVPRPRTLDLYHLGPELGHDPGRERSGDKRSELQDPKPLKRPFSPRKVPDVV